MHFNLEELVFFILVAILVFQVTDCARLDREWEGWKRAHHVKYNDSAEEQKRYAIFKKNRETVQMQNLLREETGFTVGMNQFSDMTLKEIEENILTLRIPPSEKRKVRVKGNNAGLSAGRTRKTRLMTTLIGKRRQRDRVRQDVSNGTTSSLSYVIIYNGTDGLQNVTVRATNPTTPTIPVITTTKGYKFPHLDWRESGAITPVKNQQRKCGSCWAFSTTGALEGRLKIKSGQLISLSEQNLVDCSRSGNNGCNGGWMNRALNYVRDVGGLNTGQAYPYEAIQRSCRLNNSPGAKHAQVQNRAYQEVANNEGALMEALKGGPVMVALYSSLPSFLYYKSGIYVDKNCPTNRANHAVLLVGYGSDEATGARYWILKNSWDTTWGENGYMRITRDGNQCGILSYASYPILL